MKPLPPSPPPLSPFGLRNLRATASAPACLATLALLAASGALALQACSAARPPDWRINAANALDRFSQAYLKGEDRLQAREFAQARAEVARSGQTLPAQRIELTRCAAQVASLVFDDCPGFAAMRADAQPAELAYHAWLQGQALDARQAALLPAAYRAPGLQRAAGANADVNLDNANDTDMKTAGANATGENAKADTNAGTNIDVNVANADDPANALPSATRPMARLIAAGVLLRRNQASPTVVNAAVDTASEQGWRRPLLAWLGVQARLAELRGDAQEAGRVRRRMALVQQAP